MSLVAQRDIGLNFKLSSHELKEFHKNGIVGPFTVYQPEEMRQMFKKIRPRLIDNRKNIYQSDDSVSGVTNLSNYDRHFDISDLSQHICKKEIVDRVASILGDDLTCWRTEFFPKYPGDEGTDWHQAGTFANVTTSKKPQIEWPEGSNGRGTITVWTAFTESTIDNGCMQVIPGSHKTIYYDEMKSMEYDSDKINQLEKGDTRRGFFGYDYRQLQVDPDWRPDESKARSLVMQPGQCIIFWSTLLHASHPHSGKTKDMRLGYAARYLPTSVKVYPYSDTLDEFGGKASLENYGTVLVAGDDKYKHNKMLSENVHGEDFDVRKW